MIHHEKLRPPIGDYPPDEWCVIEKKFRPEFTAQMETILALGNGYLGMRGVFEEGRGIEDLDERITHPYQKRRVEEAVLSHLERAVVVDDPSRRIPP